MLCRGKITLCSVCGKRNELLVDRVEDDFGVREIITAKLMRRHDVIGRADNDGRCIQVIKGDLCNRGSYIAHDGAALGGIADDDDLACFGKGCETLSIPLSLKVFYVGE